MSASAATITWIGGADTNWYSKGNWSPAQIPTATDDVTIDSTAMVAVSASSPSITFNTLTLGDSLGSTSPTLKVSTTIATAGSLSVYSGATLQQDTTWQFSIGTVTVHQGGILTHTSNNSTSRAYVIYLSVSGNFDLQSGSTIAVDGRGYPIGPGAGQGGATGGSGGGGAHGGAGGNGKQAGCCSMGGAGYDSLSFPTDLGSGGGVSGDGCAGGLSGGAVILSVGRTLTINGLVSANGLAGGSSCGYGGGGGAGGTINITATNLSGSGSLLANGGAGSSGGYYGGGGGGGRIAVVVTNSDSSTFTVSAVNGSGGVGSLSGGAGTFATKPPGASNYNLAIGDLTHVPQSTTAISGASFTFSTVTLNNSRVAFDSGSTTTVTNLLVFGYSTMTANDLILTSTATVKNGGTFALTSNFVSSNNITMDVAGGGILLISAGSLSFINLLVETSGVFQQMNTAQLNFTSVNVQPGGVLTHGPNPGGRQSVLNLNVTGDFNL